MKTPKLLALCALSAGLLTAATTTPVFARSGNHTAKHEAKTTKTDPLGLTTDQRSQLKAIEDASKAQVKAVKADKTLSKKDRRARIQAIHADRDTKVNAILTPAQQEQLAALHAKKHADKKASKTTNA